MNYQMCGMGQDTVEACHQSITVLLYDQ